MPGTLTSGSACSMLVIPTEAVAVSATLPFNIERRVIDCIVQSTFLTSALFPQIAYLGDRKATLKAARMRRRRLLPAQSGISLRLLRRRYIAFHRSCM